MYTVNSKEFFYAGGAVRTHCAIRLNSPHAKTRSFHTSPRLLPHENTFNDNVTRRDPIRLDFESDAGEPPGTIHDLNSLARLLGKPVSVTRSRVVQLTQSWEPMTRKSFGA